MLRGSVVGAVALGVCLGWISPALAGPADDPANWRKVDPENLLVFTIKAKEVIIELRPDIAPNHVAQVRKITRDTNYDNLPFHRVIDDFMAQGGETYAKYQVYPRYPLLKAEFTWARDPGKQPVKWFGKTASGDQLGYFDGFIVQGQPDAVAQISSPPLARTWAIHCPGILSMARTDAPDTGDTQFFMMRHSRTGTPDEGGLDKAYSIWGRALTGLEVIRSIKPGPEDTDGRFASPSQADKLSKAIIAADLPKNKQPAVYVRRTDGPEFGAALAAATAATPAEACALPPVEAVVERPTQ